VSFPFLTFIIPLPSFPIRSVFLIGGLLPFYVTHPWRRTVGVFVVQTLVIQGLPIAQKWIEELIWSFHQDFARKEKERYSSIGQGFSDVNPLILANTFLQRVMDDDRLSDSCWNAEMSYGGMRDLEVDFLVSRFRFALNLDSGPAAATIVEANYRGH
jgi:hypothetical protein